MQIIRGLTMTDREYVLENWQYVSQETRELLEAIGVCPGEVKNA